MAQRLNPLPALRERVLCLGQEDPLEKEMTTHSSVLAWKTPWMEEPGRLQRVGHDGVTITFIDEKRKKVTKTSGLYSI